MMKRFLTLAFLLPVLTFQAMGQQPVRYDDSSRPVIAAKGDVLVGGAVAFSSHRNDNYTFAVVEGINSVGYRISASPQVCYMFADNMGAGVRMTYTRSMMDAASASVEFGQVGLSVKDYSVLSQDFGFTGFFRYLIPIADSRRFAMFADAGLRATFGSGKDIDGRNTIVSGTYRRDWSLGLVVNPGLWARLSDSVSVFASVGMAGLGYASNNQEHNRIDEGRRGAFSAYYLVDLTALNIGAIIYL